MYMPHTKLRDHIKIILSISEFSIYSFSELLLFIGIVVLFFDLLTTFIPNCWIKIVFLFAFI